MLSKIRGGIRFEEELMNPWLALFSNGNKFLRDRAWPRFVIARYDGFSCNLR